MELALSSRSAVRGPGQMFAPGDLLRRTWPFAVAIGGAFATLPIVRVVHPSLALAAGGVAIATAAAVALVPWDRLPPWAETGPPLAVAAVAHMLREATGGLSDIVDYEALLFLPVFWFALYGSARQVMLAAGAGAASFSLTAATAPSSGDEWVKAAVWASVALLVGLRTHALVTEIRRFSSRDAVTQLVNRGHWEAELVREISRAERSDDPLSVALIDLDRFKQLNDERGHGAGDAALRRVGVLWTEALRPGDLLGRYGGDEFAVLLPRTERIAALTVAERMRAALAGPGPLTCSIGVAQVRAGEEPADVVVRADTALYEAKRAGGDRVVAARPSSTGP